MAPVPADMHRLEARTASFAAITRPKRLAKIAFPLDAATYPALTPASLASAGFYHTPVSGEEDAVACFLCELALSGWDAGDNPHVEHVGRDVPCAWKELVCAPEADRVAGGPGRLRTEFGSADELPSSEKRTAMRVETFGDWWPHTAPSALDLARAGFICTPSKGSPDGTTCPLCKYEVVEWEEDDDPMAIHKRKEPSCPFFTATVKKGRRTTKAASAASKRVTRGQVADDSVVEIAPPEEPAAPKRRGRPPKASTASAANTSTASATAKPRAKRKTAAEKRAEAEAEAAAAAAAAEAAAKEGDSLELPDVPEDVDDDSVQVLDAPLPATPPAPARSTRSRSTSRQPAAAEERATKPLPRKGRARKTTQNEAAAEAEPPSRAARSAPARVKGDGAKEPEKEEKESKPEALAPSQADNLPTPAPAAASKDAGSTDMPVPKSPDIAEVVSEARVAVKVAGAATDVPALSAHVRAMMLEDYVRQRYRTHYDDLRERGEAMLAEWEARAREGRERLERALA